MQDLQQTPSPEQQDQILKLQKFMIENKDRIEAWGMNHPKHVDPPIAWHEGIKDFIWQNRSSRRSE